MPPRRTTPAGYHRARLLRRTPTVVEKILWKNLRAHRFKEVGFRRQHAIGPYIVDFCAPRLKLIIEVDGGQHADQLEYDATRTAYLLSKGFIVMRFWNNAVSDTLEGVLHTISEKIL